ncbi:Gfo/Idh/MocA family protein [Nesterenkonia sp. Act20]|uniref:Gfo/Idh/MocA family protein n=1 Tax=Nesterenkonia sp. Act20 TaxID=1483432 RepID=UPI0021002585|nr:Gfo/Idh/MocA family oxidoreductase [Nesterenkonia sp. Act20]
MSTIPEPSSHPPVRIVQVGAGGMGRQWISAIGQSSEAELVGLVDLDVAVAADALTAAGLGGVQVGRSVEEVLQVTHADAVVNVTIPEAHHAINVEALFRGLPVLCEKPIAPTLSQALSLAAAAEASGQLLMTSQSRRYFNNLSALKTGMTALGEVGLVSTEFFKAPHFGGFREEMRHVLLVDMAIHAFDVARFLLEEDPVSVYCEEFNPAWSWYSHGAAANALFEFDGGARYSYSGSWCSDGHETSWNGRWRINGEFGTALWDGENKPSFDLTEESSTSATEAEAAEMPEEIHGSLAEFLDALKTGSVPSGEVHSNILTLAMVEAAVRSADTGRRVLLNDMIEEAYESAVKQESVPAVAEAMTAWTHPRAVLGQGR